MGQEIGFDLYEKAPFDKDRTLIAVKNLGDYYVCGRTDSTNSWGDLFKFEHTSEDTPVFQEGLIGKEYRSVDDDFVRHYVACDFDEFKQHVMTSVTDDFDACDKDKRALLTSINNLKKSNGELRELQKTCTEEQSYAFDRWEEEIHENKQSIAELTEAYAEYDDDDYVYLHAKWVKELLEDMERYIKEDKYYVIPFFSY